MKLICSVSYAIWNDEALENGEPVEDGMVIERTQGASLRDCVKALHKTRTSHVGGVSSTHSFSTYDGIGLTVNNSMEYRTGDEETRTLHISGKITPASKKRLQRVILGR